MPQQNATASGTPPSDADAGLGIRIRLAGEVVHEVRLDDPRQSWIESFNRLHSEDGMQAEIAD